jgi:hypothetical protein
VWIQPIAVFGVSSNPAVRVGYYQPGSIADRTELFSVPTSAAQTVDVTADGSTSFDPGSAAFSLYSIWPGFQNTDGTVRTVYGEDVFNTFDTHSMRHLRFYPYKNINGSLAPNTYLMAFEEFNSAYDNQDFVAVIHNVKPATAGAEIGVDNLSDPANPDRLVFNRFIAIDPAHPNTTVHNLAKVRVRNSGTSQLLVSAMDIDAGFSVVAPTTAFTVNPGKFVDVTVQFTGGSTVGLKSGNLVLHTNDVDEPLKTIALAGFNQSAPESTNEPPLATIGQMFGLGTVFEYPGQMLTNGGKVEAVGDEILSPYWVRADTSLPVHVQEIASFHTQGDTATVKFHTKGSTTTTNIFTIDGLDAQTLYPRKSGLTGPAVGDFTPSGTFGFRVDNEWSDDTKNPQEQPGGGFGHHVRFFMLRDSRGFFIPNTYLMTMDYNGVNYDYEDNIYVISNMRPENLPASVTGFQAYPSTGGIKLDWADATDSGLQGYYIYRSTRPSARFSLLTPAPLTVSEFLDTTASPGVQYYYRVATATSTVGVPASGTAVLA